MQEKVSRHRIMLCNLDLFEFKKNNWQIHYFNNNERPPLKKPSCGKIFFLQKLIRGRFLEFLCLFAMETKYFVTVPKFKQFCSPPPIKWASTLRKCCSKMLTDRLKAITIAHPGQMLWWAKNQKNKQNWTLVGNKL